MYAQLNKFNIRTFTSIHVLHICEGYLLIPVYGKVCSYYQYFHLSLKETLAEEAVVVMDLNDFVESVKQQVYEGGVGGLCQRYHEWKRKLGWANITLIVCGIEAYLRLVFLFISLC